jgi:hypothetical protein
MHWFLFESFSVVYIDLIAKLVGDALALEKSTKATPAQQLYLSF